MLAIRPGMRHFDDIPLLGQAALQVVGGLYFIFDDENLHSDVRSVASAILRPLSRRTVNERSPSAADSRLTTSSAIAGAPVQPDSTFQIGRAHVLNSSN